jgi:colicin import membrane protein
MTAIVENPSAEELRAMIEAQQGELEEAERALGPSVLDSSDSRKVQARIEKARGAIAGYEAALLELDRREAAQAEEERLAAASEQRRLAYEFCAEYFQVVERVLAAQRKVQEAAAGLSALLALPGRRKVQAVQFRAGGDPGAAVSTDLDTDLLVQVPSIRLAEQKEVPIFRMLTVESCAALRARALELAQAEAEGRGVDYSGDPGDRVRARGERRLRLREERRAAEEERQRQQAERNERERQRREREQQELAAKMRERRRELEERRRLQRQAK